MRATAEAIAAEMTVIIRRAVTASRAVQGDLKRAIPDVARRYRLTERRVQSYWWSQVKVVPAHEREAILQVQKDLTGRASQRASSLTAWAEVGRSIGKPVEHCAHEARIFLVPQFTVSLERDGDDVLSLWLSSDWESKDVPAEPEALRAWAIRELTFAIDMLKGRNPLDPADTPLAEATA